MVFPRIDSEIQQKVISAYLTGQGRNRITRDLNAEGLKVSSASVTNIINRHKSKHSETSQPSTVVDTTTDINKTTSSPLLSEVGTDSS